MPFDPETIRADFPLLQRSIRGVPLAYLDNAATTHKPAAVLAAIDELYRHHNANVHRGAHTLSIEATEAYEHARRIVQRCLGAEDPSEIVWQHGATDGLNLLAHGLGETRLGPGDEVLVTALEHHSNLLPWQAAARRAGAHLRIAPIDAHGVPSPDGFAAALGPRTRVVAMPHVSNALGTLVPVAEFAARAHAHDAVVVVDGCQAVPHLPVDVAALGCDAYVFSGHKTYGPTGIGVLWARRALLDELPPYQTGGEMIRSVSFEAAEWADPPLKFEAGTPHVAGAIGLGAALAYLATLDRSAVADHEQALVSRAARELARLEGVRVVGPQQGRVGVVSFTVAGASPHDVATLLDQHGIAVRSGHHCAEPLMGRLGLTGTVRASFALYNTHAEVTRLVNAVRDAAAMLG